MQAARYRRAVEGRALIGVLRSRYAFTLVEVLIVVSLMAIIAAIILPQATVSATDSKDTALRHNLKILREQITVFRLHHGGNNPGFGGADALQQLLGATNLAGNVAPVASATHPFGPYLLSAPENPFNGGRYFQNSSNPQGETPSDSLEQSGRKIGWFYNPANGDIAPNAVGRAGDGTPRIAL